MPLAMVNCGHAGMSSCISCLLLCDTLTSHVSVNRSSACEVAMRPAKPKSADSRLKQMSRRQNYYSVGFPLTVSTCKFEKPCYDFHLVLIEKP